MDRHQICGMTKCEDKVLSDFVENEFTFENQ